MAKTLLSKVVVISACFFLSAAHAVLIQNHGRSGKTILSSKTNAFSTGRTEMQSWSTLGVIHKTEYWGKIRIGSPPEEYTVIFDTGSGNLILPSASCTDAACTAHKRYDLSKSTSGVQVTKAGNVLSDFPDEKREATVRFGTGEIHGQFVKDKVCLGGAELSNDAGCTNAAFIMTDHESEQPFIQCQFDGIMGLGFADLSMGKGFNMIDDFVSAGSLGRNQFSVYLSDDEKASELTFGGYKAEQAASEVFWVPVNRQSYWQISIDDIAFNNEKKQLCKNCQVAVDTGTSLLAGPSDVIEELGNALNLEKDCSNFDEMPLLGFVVGDKVLNLRPDDYIDKSSADGCTLALMSLDVPPPKGPIFVFGDPFLRRFLTVYDRDGPSVGFAVAKQESDRDYDISKLLGVAKESSSSGMKETNQKIEESKKKEKEEELNAESTLKSIVSDWETKDEESESNSTDEKKINFSELQKRRVSWLEREQKSSVERGSVERAKEASKVKETRAFSKEAKGKEMKKSTNNISKANELFSIQLHRTQKMKKKREI